MTLWREHWRVPCKIIIEIRKWLANWWFEWNSEAVDDLEDWYTLYIKGKAQPIWAKLVGFCMEILWSNRNGRREKGNVAWSKEIFVRQFTWKLKKFLEFICEYEGWIKIWLTWSLNRKLFDLEKVEDKYWTIKELVGIDKRGETEKEWTTQIAEQLMKGWET